jgi:hypothetical protein
MQRLAAMSVIILQIFLCGISIPAIEAADHEVTVAAAADLSSALEESS